MSPGRSVGRKIVFEPKWHTLQLRENVKRNSKLVNVSSKTKSVKAARFKHIVMNMWSITARELRKLVDVLYMV